MLTKYKNKDSTPYNSVEDNTPYSSVEYNTMYSIVEGVEEKNDIGSDNDNSTNKTCDKIENEIAPNNYRCAGCGTNKETKFASVGSHMSDITKVVVRFVGKPCCMEETNAYLKDMTEIYDKKIPFVVLYDATNVGILNKSVIMQQAKYMRSMDMYTRMYMSRCAIVVSSNMARTMLNTLFMIRKPVVPLKIYSDVLKAKQFLNRN